MFYQKSPVVDGLVRRSTHGEELRYVTKLCWEEKQIAAKVARGFGQRICGFDLIRAGSRRYVIDVNGWSFVKDNEDYYNICATILRSIFTDRKFKKPQQVLDDVSLADTASDGGCKWRTSAYSHLRALETILKSPSTSKISA
jgi:inositol hexakisphosphate/diphosphoinositol-pentakisphosphate kinase